MDITNKSPVTKSADASALKAKLPDGVQLTYEVVSTEIPDEYAELPERYYSALFAERTLLAFGNVPTSIRAEQHSDFSSLMTTRITVATDRNRFTHAAVVDNAGFIVTNDVILGVCLLFRFQRSTC